MDLRKIYNDHMESDYNTTGELGLSKTEVVFSNLFRGDLLEVGCGNGRLGLTLLSNRSVKLVTFLDVSDVCIKYVQEGVKRFKLSNRNRTFYRSSLEDIKLIWEKDFDTITFFEGLEHVVDVKVAVDRIYSLLRKGGTFIGSVPVGMVCDHYTHLHHFNDGDIEEILSDKFCRVEVKSVLVNQEADEFHYVFKATK